MRHLATLQPSVPAPSKRHFVWAMIDRSSVGMRRHRISLRLRSTEDSANLQGRGEGWREGGKERGREERGREGGKEGRREGEREGRREGGREGGFKLRLQGGIFTTKRA